MTAINSIMNIAASGMLSQQSNVDVISNNIANSHTNGFRKVRSEFADVVNNAQTTGTEPMMAVAGVDVTASHRIVTPGSVVQSTSPLDLAINGEGYFQVKLPDGSSGYTRDGSLTVDAKGQLVTSSGLVLMPELTIDGSLDNIKIDSGGKVTVLKDGEAVEGGQLSLVKFDNPEGLEATGYNAFRQTANSGAPITGTPGTDGFGSFSPMALEMSNVDIAEEMVNLISAQRAYQLSSRAFQVADEMAGIANGIRS